MTDAPVPTDAHPDSDTLADLQEGLLPPSRSAGVREHLERCTTCRHDFALLEGMPARLATAGEVGSMPTDVTARIDEVLAAEGRPATATITPLAGRSRRVGRDNRVLQAAAGVVLVLAATAVGVSALQDRAGDDTTADRAIAGADAGAAAPELTSGSVQVLATGTDYTADSVTAAVPRLVGGDAADAAPEVMSRDVEASAAGRLAEGPALAGCVTALADDPDTAAVELPTPLVVDIASFSGRPAAVFVLPTPDEPERVDVFVVGPECSPDDAKVLYFARVPRP